VASDTEVAMSTQRNAIEAKGEDVVLKPVEEVFDAVVDPAVLSGYCISAASDPLECVLS
jgi:hypothetical protein